jgi:hypothetical protein
MGEIGISAFPKKNSTGFYGIFSVWIRESFQRYLSKFMNVVKEINCLEMDKPAE